MSAAATHVVLVGATTPIGQELLVRLGVYGVEVTAYLPDGDDGQTGEYACRLAHESAELVAAARAGAWIMDCDRHAPHAVVAVRHDVARRFDHAPLMAEAVRRIREAAWPALLRDPWGGRAMPLVHERDVATVIVEAVRHDRDATAIGGPEALTWSQVVRAVLAADGRAPLWQHVVGRWPAPQYPEAALDALARVPHLGRRTLAELLARRDSAARPAVARPGAASHVPSLP